MRFFLPVAFSFLVISCAKIAPPPGKPEMNPPQMDVVYDSTFSGFPIALSVGVRDESPVRFVRVSSADGRKYGEVHPMVRETTLTFLLDTFFDYSPNDSVWKGSNLKVEAADIYDNTSTLRLFIRNPRYVPPSSADSTGGKKSKSHQ